MSSKKTILLKLTGEVLHITAQHLIEGSTVRSIAQQIRQLSSTHYFGIVIGGGNFFRGNKQGIHLGLSPSVGHQIGMQATLMNGLIVKDLFEQEGIRSTLFSAVPSSEVAIAISQQAIKSAIEKDECVIFSGGTGNPFFTTDTTSILRGLQIEADCVWKGTNVNGIYSADPRKDPQAQLMPTLSFEYAIDKNLKILDATAFTLAKENRLKIRVFDIFKRDALINAAQDESFGSSVE